METRSRYTMMEVEKLKGSSLFEILLNTFQFLGRHILTVRSVTLDERGCIWSKLISLVYHEWYSIVRCRKRWSRILSESTVRKYPSVKETGFRDAVGDFETDLQAVVFELCG